MADTVNSDSEDYDTMPLDTTPPTTDSLGGSRDRRASLDTALLNADSANKNGSIRRSSDSGRPLAVKWLSQIRLEKTEDAGGYKVTADDPEVQEILRLALAREQAAEQGALRARSLRDLVFTRQFTTFDRQNPLSADSPFHGFFTLFWIAMVLMFCKVSAENWRQYGSIVGTNEVMQLMFRRDVVVLGLTDLAMLASTALGLLLQKAILRGYLKWATSGWIIQNIWQSFFLAAVIGWTYYREWPWTHTTFMVLHAITYIMKQHSYASYNGHLSGVWRRKEMLVRKLNEFTKDHGLESVPVANGSSAKTTSADLDSSQGSTAGRARPGAGSRTTTNLGGEISDVARVSKAIESGKPLDSRQVQAFQRVIATEINDLDYALQGKASSPAHAYPHNLTMHNFVDWTCLPTLVYELEYPRQDHINWWYVAEKSTATFGVIGVMMVISQAYIYPLVAHVVELKSAGMPLQQRWEELPWLISDMLFPMLLEQLLSWYVIWECVLNVLAEVTRFADRGFYGPWWNSVSFEQYARDWNRPVHTFLLRHVYHSSISSFHLSKAAATFVTFLLSALVHELVMACLFKTVRGYLFAFQLVQIPLAAFSRSKIMKGRDLLGNTLFWAGLFIGPSIISSLYLLI